MRHPQTPISIFKKRRDYLISHLKDHEAIVLFSQPVQYRQENLPYPYRQNSFFYYLTGFEEPHSCLILKKSSPSHILLVQAKDPKKEMWEGLRFGPKKAALTFGMDESESLDQLEKLAPSYFKKIQDIYYLPFVDSLMSQKFKKILLSHKSLMKKYRFLDVKDTISSMRMIKSEDEIQKIKKACEISNKGHQEVMKFCKPGINERSLHGVFISSIMSQGADRESYGGIFASGENALILHYTNNNQTCQEGDLVLVDAGAEWDYYASDISRTFPVSGRFSKDQKILYNHLLSVQKQIIKMVRPGISFKRLQSHTRKLIFEFLRKENIFQSQHKEEDVSFIFPHHIGHLLGLDVHDVRHQVKDERIFSLKPGMVLTIEPGIYIPKTNPDIPSQFRGMGLRIEDNILVTQNGYQNLSSMIPKEVDEIESLMSP